MRRLLHYPQLLLLMAICISANAQNDSIFRKVISEQTASTLVTAAIVALGVPIPEDNIAALTTYWSPEFYNYQAWLPQPDKKPLLTFYFGINPWNGDVWDTKNCRLISSPAIVKQQQVIWQHSGLPPEARDPLHHKIPGQCGRIAK
jgi:hypothetical protein